MRDDWPFDDPPETEVILLDRILAGESPILMVARDEDDPAWQFLDGDHVFEDDAVIVLLGEVAQLDPSVLELRDLPVGSHAWRASPGHGWTRGEGEPPATFPTKEGEG